MSVPPDLIHGARAKVGLYDPLSGQVRTIGIWNSFSANYSYGVASAYILGRFSPAGLITTDVSPVSITASGWRVMDHDAMKEGGFTELADLLNQQYLVLTVVDRQTDKQICTIQGCLPTSTSIGIPSRQLAETSNTYQGLLMSTEGFTNAEAPGAANLP